MLPNCILNLIGNLNFDFIPIASPSPNVRQMALVDISADADDQVMMDAGKPE